MNVGGLRERKKRETYEAISQAAQELVHGRGLDAVTIDEIADAACVSTRTFFNYFSCKEEAVVGVEPGVIIELGDELRDRHEGQSSIDALRAVLGVDPDPRTKLRRWQLRNELVRRYPALLPRHLAAMAQVESALAQALADRTGVDAQVDPSPRILVAAVLAALRASVAWWEESARAEPLSDVIDRAFAHIVSEQPTKP